MVTTAVLFAFIAGVGLVLILAHLGSKIPEMRARRRLDDRLQEIAGGDKPELGPAALIKSGNDGPLPGLDRILGRTSRGSALAAWIEQSGTKASVSFILIMALVSGMALAVTGGIFTRTGLSLPVGFAIGAALPFLVLHIRRRKRINAFEEQFPEALDLIARALKAGHAFATGLKMVADEMEEPVGPEFRKTFDEQNFGLPLKDSL